MTDKITGTVADKGKYRYFLIGRKDGIKRYVTQVPHTVFKWAGRRYVDVQIRLDNGKLVVQRVLQDRIQREKVDERTFGLPI